MAADANASTDLSHNRSQSQSFRQHRQTDCCHQLIKQLAHLIKYPWFPHSSKFLENQLQTPFNATLNWGPTESACCWKSANTHHEFFRPAFPFLSLGCFQFRFSPYSRSQILPKENAGSSWQIKKMGLKAKPALAKPDQIMKNPFAYWTKFEGAISLQHYRIQKSFNYCPVMTSPFFFRRFVVGSETFTQKLIGLVEYLPIFLGFFFGDGHSLPGGFVNVVFGFDVHLESHDAQRFEGARAALLDAFEAALRPAHHGGGGEAEAEGCTSTAIRTARRKPQPLKKRKEKI